ncbi:MAG TPA: aldehyde ferredoxin oxidoreductase family protein, partial [Anaerolineales bacterium]|nr:aldehyde ferredoxin oxidoreductase family protein [Anaerolineales bacterium]
MQPILTVDLSSGATNQFEIPQVWAEDYLGGASLAARILYDRLIPSVDPLSPQAPLLFMNGPLTGTAGPSVGRFVICARSPATRLWGESNCGGFWGPELRKAGYDGLLITGKAPQPVYLWIDDGRVELRQATHLRGLDTYATQEALKTELGRPSARVACIGPAGEVLIPFSLVLCDHGRVAGRTGMGAVMGAKNLKAVAVAGSQKIPLADFTGYEALRKQANRDLKTDPVSKVLRDLGTASAADYYDYLGEMPKRYFRRGTYPEEIQIGGANMAETILSGVSACHACVIACGRVVALEDGIKRKGPEYETLVGFGHNLWLNDLVFATRMGELADRYGMDSISLSGAIGLAFRLYETGRITLADTGGLTLEWGDGSSVERLVHLTARREGFGAYLAEGARALGARFRAEDEAIQVNGLEVAYHDPRNASGMALVYATSPRGACHNQSDYYLVEIGQVEEALGLGVYSPQGGAEKAANVARHQDWRTVNNSLVLCTLANVPPETVVGLLNHACGLDWDVEAMLRCGERGWNLKRVINHRLGLTRANDRLPGPLLLAYEDDAEGF